MDANQLIKALGDAAAAAKPPQEYCLLWFWTDWWPMCMTKAEWSGWMQAFGSVAALGIAVWLPYHQKKRAAVEAFALAKHCLESQCAILVGIRATAQPDAGGFRSATLSARQSVANLLRLYAQVPPSLLSRDALIAWMHAQTTAGQLNELVRTVGERQVGEPEIEQAIAQLRDNSLAFLGDLTQSRTSD